MPVSDFANLNVSTLTIELRGNLSPMLSTGTVPGPTEPRDPRAAAMKVRAFIHGTSADFSSLQEKFDALSEIWEEYNVGRSVTRYEHSAYLQVIGMGQAAIPLLLRSVAAGNTDWIYALKCITGEQVETPETIGDADEVIEAWITWGRRNGYIRSAPIHKDVR